MIGAMMMTAGGSALAAQGGSGGNGLEEVVVTAQLKEQNLQQVPIAITALSSESLAVRGMTNALDINESTPNINIAKNTGTASGMKIFMRGIGEDESRVGADPAIGVYVDDVYIGRQSGALLDLVDLERVEVLRGPQGTLYGRNSNGGAVRLVTKAPDFDNRVVIKAGVGSDNLTDAYISINRALSDNVAGQVSVMNKKQNGFIKNTDNGHDLGGIDKSGARVALAYLGQQWDVVWSADFSKDTSQPSYASKVKGVDNDNNLFTVSQSQFPTAFPNGRGYVALDDFYNKLYQRGTNLRVTGTINDMEFTSITAYRELDNELLTIIGAPYYQDLNQDQISQEFRLAGSSGALDWVSGVFLYREAAKQFTEFVAGAATMDITTESAAVFGQVTYSPTDALHLTGGLRYTYENKDLDVSTTSNYWSATGRANAGKQSDTWNSISWKAVAAYDFTESLMGYVSATTGFKSGGWSSDNFAPVDSESVLTYEIGMKSDLSSSLRLNMVAFYNDYKDLQVNGTAPTGGFTRLNAGDVASYGLEADVTWRPVDRLQIDGYVGTLHAEYKSIDARAAALIDKDTQLKQAPKLSYGVNATYRLPVAAGELVSNVQYAHTAEQYNDLTNTDAIKRRPTDIVNARFSYEWGEAQSYSVGLWGKNLLDQQYAAAGTNTNLAVYPGDPRTWGVDFKLQY